MTSRDEEPSEYVGYIWRNGEQRIDFTIEAVSLQEAKRAVLAKYGDDFAISIWNEEDAKRRR